MLLGAFLTYKISYCLQHVFLGITHSKAENKISVVILDIVFDICLRSLPSGFVFAMYFSIGVYFSML